MLIMKEYFNKIIEYIKEGPEAAHFSIGKLAIQEGLFVATPGHKYVYNLCEAKATEVVIDTFVFQDHASEEVELVLYNNVIKIVDLSNGADPIFIFKIAISE